MKRWRIPASFAAALILFGPISASVAHAASAESVLPPEPCSNTATLEFEEAPSTRIGDPNEVAKQIAGMSPLQVKRVEIEARDTDISVRLLTHRSFEDFWEYAQKRAKAGAPLRNLDGGPLRGPLTVFNITPKHHPDKTIQIRAWLEYSQPSIYTPRLHVASAAELAATMPVTGDPTQRALPQADIASPIDITLGLNEAELRIPTKNYDFEADEELILHFRKGDAAVCVPEQD